MPPPGDERYDELIWRDLCRNPDVEDPHNRYLSLTDAQYAAEGRKRVESRMFQRTLDTVVVDQRAGVDDVCNPTDLLAHRRRVASIVRQSANAVGQNAAADSTSFNFSLQVAETDYYHPPPRDALPRVPPLDVHNFNAAAGSRVWRGRSIVINIREINSVRLFMLFQGLPAAALPKALMTTILPSMVEFPAIDNIGSAAVFSATPAVATPFARVMLLLGSVDGIRRDVMDDLRHFMQTRLVATFPTHKVGLTATIILARDDPDQAPRFFRRSVVSTQVQLVENTPASRDNALTTLLRDIFSQIFEKDFGQSGFMLVQVNRFRLDSLPVTVQISASSWIATPHALDVKKCTINVRNYDNQCGKYAFAIGVHLAEGRRLPSNVQHQRVAETLCSAINWADIPSPVALKDWDAVEKQNPGYQVFVYQVHIDKSKIVSISTLRLPKNHVADAKHVYLCYLESETEDEERTHYLTITKLPALFNTKTHRHLCCPYCGCTVRQAEFYKQHVDGCSLVCESVCEMPEPGSVRQFTNFFAQIADPISFYADFECRMVDIVDEDGISRRTHAPVSYAIYVHNMFDGLTVHPESLNFPSHVVTFKDENPVVVVQHLMDKLTELSDNARCFLSFRNNEHPAHKHACTNIDRSWDYSTICCVCKQTIEQGCADSIKGLLADMAKRRKRKAEASFDEAEEGSEDEGEAEVEYDSDGEVLPPFEFQQAQGLKPAIPFVNFFTGEMYGPAHHECVQVQEYQLRKKWGKNIKCFFHNGTGYDFKIILQFVGQCNIEKLESSYCIAQSSERFKRIDLCGVSLVDSMSHLNASLQSLLDRVTNKGTQIQRCQILKKQMSQFLHNKRGLPLDSSVWEMLARKGVFPYGWFDNFDKLNAHSLPPIEAFISDLTGDSITPEEYAYAQEVWSATRCQTFGCYHDVYLITDVLALAEVMLAYSRFSMTHYGIDPIHYASAPAAAFDAMMQMTNAKIELISDVEIYRAFEQAIRGGVAMAVHPHTVAHNKYTRLTEGDESLAERDDDSFIVSLDENNMYGGAMSRFLPSSGFRWLTHEEVANFRLATLSEEDGPVGFLLDVDLQFPRELHDYFNDFPPAPESIMVEDKWLSELQRQAFNTEKRARSQKLVPHLNDHRHYHVHGCTLKLYLTLGVVVSKVHRILTFQQTQLIKPWVDLNTSLRKKAAEIGDTLAVEQAKLMVNATYGKTLQNVRKYADYKLAKTDVEGTSERRLAKMVAKNTLKRFVCMKSLYVLEFAKKKVRLNQPLYLGAATLDYAKLSIYRFWYKTLKPNFADLKLIYTDTDSLIVHVRSGDIYRDCKQLEERNNGGPITTAGQGVFDWSSLDPVFHAEYYSTTNSKELGKFKFDDGSNIVCEFIALRSKMYTKLRVFSPAQRKFVKNKIAAKGVPRMALPQLDFEDCLQTGSRHKVSFVRIGGRQFDVATKKEEKEGLAPPVFNDKRFITYTDGVYQAWALGHARHLSE